MELLSSQRISKDYALYQSSLEDTEWSRIIRQTGMPPAAFSSEARKRRRETASKIPASVVTNDMILHGTHLRSPVKEDVRGPTRWALDVRKLQHERKQRQFDMKGIIPLPRACIIKQQNHQINTKNGRRAGLLMPFEQKKIDAQMAALGAPPVDWNRASTVSWFRSRPSKKPKIAHRERKYDPLSPYSAWPQIQRR